MKRSKFLAVFVLFSIIFNCLPIEAYTLSKEKIETPENFNKFLNSCTYEDCKILMQALGDEGDPTPEGIRKALVWRAYNKMTYMLRGDKEIEYHEIVQWAAEKKGIDEKYIKYNSTFQLEEEIAKKLYEEFSELPPEKRKEIEDSSFLGFIMENVKEWVEDKGEDLAFKGLKAYHNLEQEAEDDWGAWITKKVVDGGILAGYGVYASLPDSDKVCAFIASVHLIKLRKFR